MDIRIFSLQLEVIRIFERSNMNFLKLKVENTCVQKVKNHFDWYLID